MMNNITCLDNESEATEDWVCSGDQFQDACCCEKYKIQKKSIIVISICFSYSKCLFRGELEADENHWYF